MGNNKRAVLTGRIDAPHRYISVPGKVNMFRKLKRLKIPRSVLFLSGVGTVTGLLVIFKDRIGNDPYYGDEQLTGRTVIITGTTSGMGKELAKQLADRGGRVLMACRDMEKCETVRKEIVEMTFNKNVECKKLDLSSLQSIREFATDINETEPRLDVLVNNAAVMCTPYTITEDGFELQLAVNYLGPFLLTNLLLDKLKESKPSRIVHVGSVAYIQGNINFNDLNNTQDYVARDAYAQSKLALLLFNLELGKHLEGTGVSTYLVHPGIVKTELGRHLAMRRTFISKFFLNPFLWLFLMTPRQGVQTMLHCALSEDAAGISGKYWTINEVWPVEDVGEDEEVAHRLWMVSERWTRLKS